MLESDAGHSELLFFACNASSILQPFHCSLQLSQLGTLFFPSSGCPIFCADAARLPALLPVQSHKRMSNDSASTRVISTVQLICQHSQSVIKTSVDAFASVTVADSLSTVKTSLAPRCTCVVPKRRIHFLCFPVAEAYQGLSCAPRLGWRVLDSWQLPLPRPLSAQGIVANLSRLGGVLAVELAAVASAATPDVTADSPFLISVSCSNAESQQGMVLGLGMVEGRLGTCVAPELLPDSGS